MNLSQEMFDSTNSRPIELVPTQSKSTGIAMNQTFISPNPGRQQSSRLQSLSKPSSTLQPMSFPQAGLLSPYCFIKKLSKHSSTFPSYYRNGSFFCALSSWAIHHLTATYFPVLFAVASSHCPTDGLATLATQTLTSHLCLCSHYLLILEYAFLSNKEEDFNSKPQFFFIFFANIM